MRRLYVWLLRLHPPWFRHRFAEEMLLIFDQATGLAAKPGLLLDGAVSLVRQWLLRSEYWHEPAPRARHAADGVPLFFFVENSTPRVPTLLHGGIVSVALFLGLSALVSYQRVELRAAGEGEQTFGSARAFFARATRSWTPRRAPAAMLPDTSAGQQLAEWLKAFNAADYDDLRAFGAKHADPAASDDSELQARIWGEWRRRLGPFEIR